MSQSNPTETFKEIPGFDGYRVSDWGRVQSRWKYGKGRKMMLGEAWRDLKQWISLRYFTVGLWKDGKQKFRPVHQLVLEAFVGPRPKGLIARHLNGRDTDNRATNLCWGTYTENAYDRDAHGKTQRGEAHWYAKLTEDDVREIRELRRQGMTGQAIADRFGITQSYASKVYLQQSRRMAYGSTDI